MMPVQPRGSLPICIMITKYADTEFPVSSDLVLQTFSVQCANKIIFRSDRIYSDISLWNLQRQQNYAHSVFLFCCCVMFNAKIEKKKMLRKVLKAVVNIIARITSFFLTNIFFVHCNRRIFTTSIQRNSVQIHILLNRMCYLRSHDCTLFWFVFFSFFFQATRRRNMKALMFAKLYERLLTRKLNYE